MSKSDKLSRIFDDQRKENLSDSANNRLLKSLNERQREAVSNANGPTLVLAGAGSGKTRVLTHRIAYLLEEMRTPAEQVLAVTFSNKAAQEMHDRLQTLLLSMSSGSRLSKGLWIGTFHSICARILRRDANHLGYSNQFTIYDREDQTKALESVLDAMNIDRSQGITPGVLRSRISRAKSDFLSPDDLLNGGYSSAHDELVAEVYRHYQTRLRQSNAMDFDDLLLLPLVLFQQHGAILDNYRRRFRYILVDEFQDTNRVQYVWLKALAGSHRALFAVGDDDQSIYSWRGANVRNMLDFEADFPECQVFRLEQNYRSTKNILAAAHSVIVNNRERMAKELWTEREEGEKITVLEAINEYHEAQSIVDKISEEFGRHNGDGQNYRRSFRDFAVLYRTNAQSRILEDTFRNNGIPYVIVGGLRFYERKEVKDILAYFKVMSNPADNVSLTRIVNYPLRGIGATTLGRLNEFATAQNISLFDAMGGVDETATISAGLRKKVKDFYDFVGKYRALKNQFSLTEWCNAIVDEINIIELLKKDGEQDRIDNIRELLNGITQYAVQSAKTATIEGYLEQVSLITDIDNWDNKSNAVTLMTLHSAKGLEFPIVFIAGLEEGLFPLVRNSDDSAVDEERRLFYVGATRAREKLFISYARLRSRYDSNDNYCHPSRFLRELNQEFVQQAAVRRPRAYEAPHAVEPEVIMPAYEDESQELPALKTGKRVVHESFGRGRIVGIEGRGEKLKVTVKFDEVGIKKILVKYGNLRLL